MYFLQRLKKMLPYYVSYIHYLNKLIYFKLLTNTPKHRFI